MDMENKRRQVWYPILFSILLILGMFLGFKLKESVGPQDFFGTGKKNALQEVLDLVSLKYVDKVPDSVTDEAINGLLHKLDPHSVYIPASELDYVNDDIRGNFSGIGVEFQIFSDTLNVLNVIQGGPSDKAGLQVGDKFIRVNDSITIAGKKIDGDKIRKLLRGETGSMVKITILRNDKLMPINITRGIIPVPSLDAAYMITPSTGFIHLNKFSETTYVEFMKAMEKLKAQNMQKLILDLRGNGGGLLNQAVNIADEFLDENKLIVYTKGEHSPKYEYSCKRDGLFEQGELVVLVDEGSASASEVLSGALQDYDRATIIGRRTFGKGLVQEQFTLSNGGALRLTVARYYTPLGRNIQKPYTDGYDKYENEVVQRFHDGEVIKGDTTIKSGPAFKTAKGRIVYGGGGITPDVYIPFDTTRMSGELMKLYSKGTLNNFVYTYYMQHKNEYSVFKKSMDLANQYKAGEKEWEALSNFAAKDSIYLNKAPEKDKAELLKRIPSLIARQIWRYEGFYEVNNTTDDFVKKALEKMNGGK